MIPLLRDGTDTEEKSKDQCDSLPWEGREGFLLLLECHLKEALAFSFI
jgi:hypothetical protein